MILKLRTLSTCTIAFCVLGMGAILNTVIFLETDESAQGGIVTGHSVLVVNVFFLYVYIYCQLPPFIAIMFRTITV